MESKSEEPERFHYFLLILFMTPSLMIQRKLDCRSRQQKWKNQPITRPRIKHCDWFIIRLFFSDSNNLVFTKGKWQRHKQNRWSASDSISLIFTRSYMYHFTLQGRVVRKPVNANLGLKVNQGNNFSCVKVLSIAHILSSLRLFMHKTEGQKI